MYDMNWEATLAIFAGVGIFLLASYFYEKRRTESLMKTAEQLGFQFYGKSKVDVIPDHESFNLFSQGHAKKVINRMHGKTGGDEAVIFGYSYTVGSGSSSSKYIQTVTHLKNRKPLPNFEMRPEHLFHKIGSAFGYQDIDFESHQEFSKNQLLRGDNEQMIRGLFSGKILEFFEQNPGYSVESNGSHMIIYLGSKRPKPEEISAFYQECQKIHKLFNS